VNASYSKSDIECVTLLVATGLRWLGALSGLSERAGDLDKSSRVGESLSEPLDSNELAIVCLCFILLGAWSWSSGAARGVVVALIDDRAVLALPVK